MISSMKGLSSCSQKKPRKFDRIKYAHRTRVGAIPGCRAAKIMLMYFFVAVEAQNLALLAQLDRAIAF